MGAVESLAPRPCRRVPLRYDQTLVRTGFRMIPTADGIDVRRGER